MIIKSLEDDQTLQDLVLSVHHCATIVFTKMPIAKIITNHLGKAFLKMYSNTQSPEPSQRKVNPPNPEEPTKAENELEKSFAKKFAKNKPRRGNKG